MFAQCETSFVYYVRIKCFLLSLTRRADKNLVCGVLLLLLLEDTHTAVAHT